MASTMAGQLENRVAMITGAGRGIGVGIAGVLVSRGAAVAVCDLDGGAAQETADAINAKGGKAIAGAVDVTDPGSLEHFAGRTISELGGIDICVPNAGVIGGPGFSERVDFTKQDWDMTFAVNVQGLTNTTEAVKEHMKAREQGKIVIIASHGGRKPGHRRQGPRHCPAAVSCIEGGGDPVHPLAGDRARVVQYQRERGLPGKAVDPDVGGDRDQPQGAQPGLRRTDAARDFYRPDQEDDAAWSSAETRRYRQDGGLSGIGRIVGNHGSGDQRKRRSGNGLGWCHGVPLARSLRQGRDWPNRPGRAGVELVLSAPPSQGGGYPLGARIGASVKRHKPWSSI